MNKVYKITNTKDGKVYIGQTRKKGKRFRNYWGSGSRIKRARVEEGKENFTKTVLFVSDCKKETDKKEKFFIKEYDSQNPEKGFNVLPGGGHNPFYGSTQGRDKTGKWIVK